MKTVYVLFTPSSQHAALEPQMTFDTFHEVTEAQDAITGTTYRIVTLKQDQLQEFLKSGAHLLEAQDHDGYLKAHEAARHGKGTLWERPSQHGTSYLVTRGGVAPTSGLLEIASFEEARSF